MNSAPRTKLRVVLDSNVYISAFNYPQGPPFRVWQHGRRGTYCLLVSPSIVRETARVLRKTFAWTEDRILRPIDALRTLGGG